MSMPYGSLGHKEQKEQKLFVPGWAWTTNLSVPNFVVTAERANRLRHGDDLVDIR